MYFAVNKISINKKNLKKKLAVITGLSYNTIEGLELDIAIISLRFSK
jgi:DNA-binding Xre family transcriptional regulator